MHEAEKEAEISLRLNNFKAPLDRQALASAYLARPACKRDRQADRDKEKGRKKEEKKT